MLIILSRESPGQIKNEVTGATGAGGDRRHERATCVPSREPVALGSLRLPRAVQPHTWGKAPPGQGGWDAGKETQALGHHAVSPRELSAPRQAGRSGGTCPGWGHPEDGRTRGESQRGSGGRWAPLSGRDSAWVTKLRREKRAGAHVGLAGLPRAGAKRGLHPGCGTAGRERGPGMAGNPLPRPAPQPCPWPRGAPRPPMG